jgi:cephalosporin hydroxylase/predicted O-methyltransferase YrrM
MFPFWKKIVEPALVAAGATRVVEIGAERGWTTVQLLQALGPESELHVIDPVPRFDPSEHARRFPGRYFFHRDISHHVLPELAPCDAALIDGDHNWFTVYHELRMLRETAREAGVPIPLLVMHDVCWPFGRRDLYYAPERIPEEFRHPYDTRGIFPERVELANEGGISQGYHNAVREGGPRNGVATAVDDFIAEHDRPLRRLVVPIWYGLALIAEQELLDARPELAALLDRLESAEGRYELLELGEFIRAREVTQVHDQHLSAETRAERGARRYVELLKGALLDEHYLENELRVAYLLECVEAGEAPSLDKLQNPARHMSRRMSSLERARRAGDVSGDDPGANGKRDALAYTTVGRVRLDHLEGCLDVIREEYVRGDLVDCGTGRGGTAMLMRGYLEAYELTGPHVWVVDDFGAGPGRDETDALAPPPDLNTVREGFDRFGLLDDRVAFLQGRLSRTLAEAPTHKVSLLRVDGHEPDEVRAALESLYDKVTLGGFVVIDDYGHPACQAVVDDFRSKRGVIDPLERVGWDGGVWRKTTEADGAGRAPKMPEGEGSRIPLAVGGATTTTTTKDLSVVVVFYNMRREATRTLHSLTRAYQEGVEDLAYEVIAVENGSDPGEQLGEEFVSSFGPEFRYIDLEDEGTASPAHALNRGIAAATGRALALMIDGAHVLTPGVLRFGMLGLSAHAPAVVTTRQWYVGPGQQPEALAGGYDRGIEDRLFDRIEWPTDGYRLFDIGHFIGDRDWFDGIVESNCIFVPRRLLEQVGGMDEGFSMPGGGFVNLDFFERMVSSPDVNRVDILGEGSFHQIHGGTTTNATEDAARLDLIKSYYNHYAELKGRAFQAPTRQAYYVGTLPDGALRTRARRMGAPAHFRAAHVEAPDWRPNRPLPVPEEQRTEFIDAFWRSEEWHRARWLGKRTHRAPTDLLAYQELIYRLRPEWIVETRTGAGGRALFLASICDLVGRGRVLSIDDYPISNLAEHPRITYLRSPPTSEPTAAEVRDIVGEEALVILGGAARGEVLTAFENYAQLVPIGSYLVIEDTILGGRPVWTGFGPGPGTAAREIVRRGEFVPDATLEYALTFNPGGFLKRVR